MPRYFFDENGTRDRDGLDLAGREQARRQAIKALPDMARDVLPDGKELTLAVAVREADGAVFFRASLILKRARMQGFIYFDHVARAEEATARLANWVREGKLHYRED